MLACTPREPRITEITQQPTQGRREGKREEEEEEGSTASGD